jgi:uncharacterized repeat protein (TIGR01451 family)
MNLIRDARSYTRTIAIVFALMVMTVAPTSMRAQGTRDAGPQNTGTDIHFHKFQPSVPPDAAATSTVTRTQAEIDAFVAQQIGLLEQEKTSRTPAQQKIDSNVLYTIRMMKGQAPAPGIASLYTGVDLDDSNNIVVDITADVTGALLGKLRSAGAMVLDSNSEYRSIRAIIPPNQIEGIAALPDVTFIDRRAEDIHGHIARGPGGIALERWRKVPGFAQREARLRKNLAALMQSTQKINTGQGSVTTEGDLTHRAFDARGTFGVNGAGLKIGVLSDSANATGALTSAQATGDMPPTCPGPGGPCVSVVHDFPGGSDEGTAMMEIIFDMAPGASLFFETADVSEANFAASILDLRNAQNCDIIVDDVFYFDESPFQDGVVAQAVNSVAVSGALYFSSAGNEGNVDSGTAGYFEGDFNDAGSAAFVFPGGAKTGTIHNFGTVGTPINGDIITARGNAYTLNWSDAHGASGNDYDLFLVDSAGVVKAQSTNIQSGTQNPFEQINPPALVAGDRLVVFKTTAAAVRAFAINTIRGTLTVVTGGQTHGHSAASGTASGQGVGVGSFSVSATPAAGAFGPGAPTGPFPNPFTTANMVEPFTSDGPRRVFYNAAGTAITPGNLLFGTNGGEVRNKPDITAADGVSTTLPGNSGLNPFFGTSAAAPHAAAIAALIKSVNPALTQTQIRTALISTALDIMAAGYDRDSGNGIVMAYQAVAATPGAVGNANPELGTITASQNPGNGDGIIKAGEGAKLVIQLNNNSGVLAATGITAALTTTTPGITITLPNTSAYADIAAGASGGNNLSPFKFTLASNVGCLQTINFTLTVSFSGQQRVLNFSVSVGSLTFTNNLGTTPTPITGVTTLTGTQTGRISRNGIASVCGTSKAFPGIISGGSRAFDSYTFTAAQAGCVNAPLSSANGANIFEVIYSGGAYDPNNLATNYAGDAGASSLTQSCGITLVQGTSYTFVVNDINLTPASGSNYTLQLPSCAVQSTINKVPVALVHDVTVTAATVGGSANASIDNGSNDPDGDPVTITQSPAGPYPHGVTNVRLTVVDASGATAQASANVTVQDPTLADMTITKSHVGNFSQGQVGATYTIAVKNSGTGATAGQVNMVDTLPASMTATALTGTGWTCVLATVSCSRSDVLGVGLSYQQITLTVTVAANAPALVTNTATVSGGGETNLANDVANDPTTITQFADLTVTVAHAGNFVQGQVGATYTLTVNNIGNAATTAAVSVSDTIPAGLTATAISGTGWVCTLGTVSCTRADVLNAGASYAAITVTVTVAGNAPALVTNSATVSGGGEIIVNNDTGTNPTTVLTPPTATLSTNTLTFPITTVGTPSSAMSVTVTNNGQASLTFTQAPALSGTNSGDFAIGNTSTCAVANPVAGGGNCVVNITITPGAAGPRGPATLTFTDNASTSPQTVSLNGTGADFSVAGPASAVTVAAGQTANFTITITPGTGGFPSVITLSQVGAPTTGTTITFTPPTVTPGGSAATSTMMITTTSRAGIPPPGRQAPRGPLPIVLLSLAAAMLAASFLMLRRSNQRRRLGWIGLAAGLVLVVAGIAGCTHVNPNGTPAGNSMITVTGTSGTLAHSSAPLTLTVQ